MASDVSANQLDEQSFKDAIDLHQNALEDLVHVNGLFTIAVFVGLTFSRNQSLEDRPECKVSDHVARHLLVYEVISFACYLLSSLVAKALKMHINTYLYSDIDHINTHSSKTVRTLMLGLSAWGSILGCLFLTMSMVDVVRVRLGKVSCSPDSMRACGALISVVSLALAIYISFTMIAIYNARKRFERN